MAENGKGQAEMTDHYRIEPDDIDYRREPSVWEDAWAGVKSLALSIRAKEAASACLGPIAIICIALTGLVWLGKESRGVEMSYETYSLRAHLRQLAAIGAALYAVIAGIALIEIGKP